MLVFVDYSGKAPISNGAPESTVRNGKFVHIKNHKDHYLVFAPKVLCKYHSDIVQMFAEDPQFSLSVSKKGQALFFDDHSWLILGGGVMTIDNNDKTIDLAGHSQAYGAFDRQLVSYGIKSTPQLREYDIHMD
jgi:hypothetical protein